MNTTKPVKIPHDWRHRAYTYYVVSFSKDGKSLFLKNPYVCGLGPASTAHEFPNKKAAKHWMRYWRDHDTVKDSNPNISKVRGLPEIDRLIVKLMHI